MTRPANHYPVEGQHGAVSVDDLREREHRKWDDHSEVEYLVNAGQDNETLVRTTVSAQRQATIDRGYRILRAASNDLNRELSNAVQKPHAVDFDEVRQQAEEHLEQRSERQSHERGQTP